MIAPRSFFFFVRDFIFNSRAFPPPVPQGGAGLKEQAVLLRAELFFYGDVMLVDFRKLRFNLLPLNCPPLVKSHCSKCLAMQAILQVIGLAFCSFCNKIDVLQSSLLRRHLCKTGNFVKLRGEKKAVFAPFILPALASLCFVRRLLA